MIFAVVKEQEGTATYKSTRTLTLEWLAAQGIPDCMYIIRSGCRAKIYKYKKLGAWGSSGPLESVT
jgi:hypothetical protein